MKSVVSELVKSETSAYVDDIFVNESVVGLNYVKRHFLKYSLEIKEGEQIGDDGVCVLGLCVRKVGNKLMWSRGNRVDAILQKLTRRVVFSIFYQSVVGYKYFVESSCGGRIHFQYTSKNWTFWSESNV